MQTFPLPVAMRSVDVNSLVAFLHFRVGAIKEGDTFLRRKHTKTNDFSGQILILFITMFITTGFSRRYVYLVGRQYV